jgi:hypothetical protein
MVSSNKRGVKTLMEKRIQRMMPLLDERQKRLYLANEAISYSRGGISLVSRISGMSQTTITKAVDEQDNADAIDGKTYGELMRVLSYTTESLKKIQTELEKDGVFVGHVTIGKILDAMGYRK